MIVYIIGGHGSGKTTIVRGLLRSADFEAMTSPGRRAPIGYLCGRLIVVGSYEIVNGGSDTVRPLAVLMDRLRRWGTNPNRVVAEGVGQAGFVRELIALSKTHDLRAVLVDTSLETCYDSVVKRGHKLSRDGVRRAWVRSQNAADELEKAGVEVVRGSRRVAKKTVMEILKC